MWQAGHLKRSWTAGVVLLLGGCSGAGDGPPVESLVIGEDVRLEGRVTGIDLTPMVVDGDGELTVESGRYGTVLVRIPARERLCRAEGLDLLHSMEEGGHVRVLGRVTGPRELVVCEAEAHFLERSEDARGPR